MTTPHFENKRIQILKEKCNSGVISKPVRLIGYQDNAFDIVGLYIT